MASQKDDPASTPTAQDVGNAFVEQYYQVLSHSTENMYRFYQDLSLLSRPDIHGGMTTVTTIMEINDKILSMNYEDCTAEIISADAQESFEKGVIVLVIGCLTGKDKLRRKFTQTFFLAPQKKGYYVLNDVFRYADEDITENPPGPTLKPEQVPGPIKIPNHEIIGTEDSTSAIHEDAREKSYAFIVKAPKTFPHPVYGVASSAHITDNALESSNLQGEAEGPSLYVANLPYHTSIEQLEEEFKKFGPIKRDGIEIRYNKQGYPFAFIEFEQFTSLQSALEASPIVIGDRQAIIQKKRDTARVNNGGSRSDRFRSRGSYGGGRGHRRSEDGYQQTDNNRGGGQRK